MITNSSIADRVRKLTQACLVIMTVVTSITALGQSVSADLSKYSDRFQKLSDEFTANQRRILSTPQSMAIQERAYTHLEYVGHLLASARREIDVLNHTFGLASLVTDSRALPIARKYVELQRDYMVKQMRLSVRHIEQTVHMAGDQETSRLLLEARDLLQSATDFVGRISVVHPKPKGR